MSIRTERLLLEPLEPAHAVEMAPLLDDPALYAYTGGEPLSADALRARYERQLRGPETGSGRWFNWILRDRAAGEAVGFVQATVDDRVADVAWVVASPYQGRGYAREAAAAMVAWLRDGGIERVTAHIHPENAASAAVARGIGLAPTDVVLDGEVRWDG